MRERDPRGQDADATTTTPAPRAVRTMPEPTSCSFSPMTMENSSTVVVVVRSICRRTYWAPAADRPASVQAS